MRLIDADKLIKTFDPNTWQGEMMIAIAKQQPTIEVKLAKRGKWIQKFEGYRSGEENEVDEIPYIVCSKCLHKEWHYDTENADVSPPNYCPNCGARMDGGGEG